MFSCVFGKTSTKLASLVKSERWLSAGRDIYYGPSFDAHGADGTGDRFYDTASENRPVW
jgi:hypothetical protein